MMRKLDYYMGASSLYTTNAMPDDAYHDNTAVANLGWSLSAKTQIRLTGRAQRFGDRAAFGRWRLFVQRFSQRRKAAGTGHLRDGDHRPHLPGQLARNRALRAGAQSARSRSSGIPAGFRWAALITATT